MPSARAKRLAGTGLSRMSERERHGAHQRAVPFGLFGWDRSEARCGAPEVAFPDKIDEQGVESSKLRDEEIAFRIEVIDEPDRC